MYPWIWFWAPNIYLPWSGSVTQTIEPDLFDSIGPQAGNATIERKACEVASYGRQLGLIIEVLLDTARNQETMSAEARKAMERLEVIQAEIEQLKVEELPRLSWG
ncbi:hypothetical protein [Trinickia fusca]|uniref:hypothetical protein n=1 Tax=Trinickia fusca TaxID=2419777 RepID=UPI001FE72028|nr:hypothetical protein [Trinickia fusca]